MVSEACATASSCGPLIGDLRLRRGGGRVREGFVCADVFFILTGAAVPPEVARWASLHVQLGPSGPRLHLVFDPRRQDWFARETVACSLSLYIRPGMLDEWLPEAARDGVPSAGAFFASEDVAAIAGDMLACEPAGSNQGLFLAAKALSLIWLVLTELRSGALRPAGGGALDADDVARLQAARRLIHERYGEPLTLDAIARSCGLSRSKLTQGFRELFRSSVGETLSERRLQQAAQSLRGSDAPVSAIGYRTGYTSNAAFTRAFTRRFGEPPTAFRARRVLASASRAPLAALESLL